MKVVFPHVLCASAALAAVVGAGACTSSDPPSKYWVLDTPTQEAVEPTEPAPAKDEPKDPPEVTSTDAGTPEPLTCRTAKDQLLGPVEKVSTGEVKTLERHVRAGDGGADDAGTADAGAGRSAPETWLLVDATAGGFQAASRNPRTYVSLSKHARVAVNDREAETSKDWDLAFKRATIFTNSGDGGAGSGGARFFAGKKWEEITAASIAGKMLSTESFFEGECSPLVDAIGAPLTSFEGWYGYEGASMVVTPTKGVFVVRGGRGALFKVEIQGYYGDPLAQTPAPSANYVVRVAELAE